jgi:hypothetical protein
MNCYTPLTMPHREQSKSSGLEFAPTRVEQEAHIETGHITPEATAERETQAHADSERVEKIRAELSEQTPERKQDFGNRRPDLMGDFSDSDVVDGGFIQSDKKTKRAIEKSAAGFRKRAKYMTNTVIGEPIAAEYDIKTRNFSTQTSIEELADGRKLFLVYNHEGSWLHRGLDTAMKWASGLRMRKATRAEWKTWFEEKSTIPLIQNADKDTVAMPFVPNVNAQDVFARNHEIENFGEAEWAKEATLDDKLELAHSIIDETKRVHETGTAWGELILPNVIFTHDKKAVICDPEVRFDDDVSLPEAKARDLKDLCLSVSGALAHGEGAEDPAPIVTSLLDRYGDRETIIELINVANQKRTLLQHLTFGYELVRSGAKGKEHYNAVLEAIRNYDTDRLRKKRK